jgi:hypothetical protein
VKQRCCTTQDPFAFLPLLLHVVVGSALSAVLPFVPKPTLRDMEKGASYAAMTGGVKRDAAIFAAVLAAAAVKPFVV